MGFSRAPAAMAAAASNSSSASAVSLKDYLKRYESSAGADDQKKKKKKKPKPVAGGVLVVDEDPVWQKPVQLEEDASNSSGDEKPLVDEDIEVKRMKRHEAIRSRKPYHAISEDGSGWVPISDSSKQHSSSVAADLDLSPPRQRCARLDTPSPGRERESAGVADQDLSPPRHQKRLDTPPLGRKQSRAETEDRNRSPPRPSRRRPSPEPGGDLSPPRKRSREGQHCSPEPAAPHDSSVPDLSPPRRRQRGSPSDLSPPRRNQQNYHRSPAARDLSPPRRSRKGSSSDLSPPRQHRSSKTLGSRESPADDLSPPRRSGKGSSGDLSPPHQLHLPEALGTKVPPAAGLLPPRKKRNEEEGKTGLLSAKEIRDENEKKKKEQQSRFKSMDPSLTGRGAEPVFRDKEGKRISKEDMLKAQEEEKPKERKLEWGKGLAQKREAEAVSRELELERDKPFARTRDDPELDKMLKERIRWGDPMAHLVKRKQLETLLEDLGDDEKMKESGFIIPQTIPSHSWIKRELDFPPNRYGIRPGRHWDGVDRSNGYEKELFKRKNEKRATEAEAYLWSVSDM